MACPAQAALPTTAAAARAINCLARHGLARLGMAAGLASKPRPPHINDVLLPQPHYGWSFCANALRVAEVVVVQKAEVGDNHPLL